jgi:phage-related protein
MLRVKFYSTQQGNEPVKEWLQSQPKDMKKLIGEDIRTDQKAWPLGMPLVKHVEGKIWELRSHIPHGIIRVFFTVKSECMVLLHVFTKKSQKLPKQELEIARKRLKEWVD